MPGREDSETGESGRRQLQGLPVIRRNVAGIDLGSERHWVCAPTRDGSGREITSFGATTPELLRLAEWLKARQVESVAMDLIVVGSHGPSAIFVASHLITDKGIRTGGCYLHEPRIDPPERSPQSRRPEVFYARSPDPQVIE